MTSDTRFDAVFDIERPQHEVWQSLRLATADADVVRLPGFPSGDGEFGARARVIDARPQQRLVCEKLDAPAEGSEITVTLDPANASGWPTRVKASQRGFAAASHNDGAARIRWAETVADFRLYLETGIEAPVQHSREVLEDFGLAIEPTPSLLVVRDVRDDSPASRLGLEPGDGLLTFAQQRIFDSRQLWTLLASLKPGSAVVADVIRANKEVRLTRMM